MAYYDLVAPSTPKELYDYIWYGCGGIKRDHDYWDSHLTWLENSRLYARLDRRWGSPHGVGIDVLADRIADEFPWFGIHDSEELWTWLNRWYR